MADTELVLQAYDRLPIPENGAISKELKKINDTLSEMAIYLRFLAGNVLAKGYQPGSDAPKQQFSDDAAKCAGETARHINDYVHRPPEQEET